MGNKKKTELRIRPSSLRNQKHISGGFTLIEVLVSLVIFGIITVALSLSFETALKNQQVNSQRSEEQGTVRAAFDFLTRDIQAAFVSVNNTQGVFVSGTTSGSSSVPSGGLLTLMTRTHRIQNEDPSQQTTGGSSPSFGIHSGSSDVPPQSDVDLIQYSYDPQAGALSRTTMNVPNLQNLTAPSGPDTVIAQYILSISLRFWDPTQQSWRTDWDYEQQNQQASSTGAGGASGTGGSATTGTAASSTSTTAAGGSGQSSTATGDTTLPGNVEVTLVLANQDGSTSTYVTTISVIAPQPIDTATPPVNTAASGSTANVRGFGK